MKSILFTIFLVLVFSGLFVGSATNPVDDVALQQSKKSQEQESGWLGVSISDLGKQRAEELKLKTSDGAYVVSVVDDSPADSVGLKKGDVITSFAGRVIYDASDLSKSVGRTAPGTRAAIELIRKGEKKTLTVIVGSAPSRERMIVRVPRARAFRFVSEFGTQGMVLLELNDQLAKYFQVPEGEGVLVTEVKDPSAAEKAGIQAGDVLMRIGGKRIDEVSDVSRVLGSFDEGEKADIELFRKGSKKTVTLTVEENETGWSIYAPHGHLGQEFFVPGEPGQFDLRFDIDEDNMHELELRLKKLDENMQKSLKLKEQELQKKLETSVRIRDIRTI